jgi:hypothetical protein
MEPKPDYSWLRGVRDVLVDSELVEPPQWVLQRARRLFTARRPSAALIDRVRASLVFDSRVSGPAQVGVRRGAVVGAEGPWQLLYRGGDVDVDLLVRPNQDGHTLSLRGQALAVEGAVLDRGVIEAMPADGGAAGPTARSELDPTGEFALSNLERGRYDVVLRFGAREIELSDLEL